MGIEENIISSENPEADLKKIRGMLMCKAWFDAALGVTCDLSKKTDIFGKLAPYRDKDAPVSIALVGDRRGEAGTTSAGSVRRINGSSEPCGPHRLDMSSNYC